MTSSISTRFSGWIANQTGNRAYRQAGDNTYSCRHVEPSEHVPTLLEDAQTGLLSKPRSLPPKYFYDETGSALFDRICDTREYYPTRAESALLQHHAPQIIEKTRPEYIVELGSGTSRKTRFLFDACAALGERPEYWPMDVCEPLLIETAQSLTADYQWLTVNALVGDYHGGFDYFPCISSDSLYLFLGGTIGNFSQHQAVDLLTRLRALMSGNDRLLLGFDRVKDSAALEAAYNDAEGVTAEFNLNLLRVLNEGLDADFDVDAFVHRAIYNRDDARIEMYLEAKSRQRVELAALGEHLFIEKGERILTEISRKFTPASIESLLHESGFCMVSHYESGQPAYSLVLAEPE